MKRLILYHANCFDGLAAAWAARQSPTWADAEPMPVNYGGLPPNVTGADVLIVDFSYPRDVLLVMREFAASLRVLDHHKTAEAELIGLDFCTFDMNRSGAGLAWDELVGGPRPMALDYIEDRDLWRHKLPYAAEVQAWMRAYPTTYPSIEFFVAELDRTGVVDGFGGPTSIVAVGSSLLAYRRQLIDDAVKDRTPIMLLGHRGAVVNFGVNELYSEVAESLCVRGMEFGVCWARRAAGRVMLSLRSPNGGCDVSTIAKHLGGGGHKHAAGAMLPWPDWLLILDHNDAWETGYLCGAMDNNESAPFASVRGLDQHGHPKAVDDWTKPKSCSTDNWPAYRAGYATSIRARK